MEFRVRLDYDRLVNPVMEKVKRNRVSMPIAMGQVLRENGCRNVSVAEFNEHMRRLGAALNKRRRKKASKKKSAKKKTEKSVTGRDWNKEKEEHEEEMEEFRRRHLKRKNRNDTDNK